MRRSILIVLGVVLLLSSVATAQRGQRRFARQGARAQDQTEQITDEQKSEIRNLRQEWNKDKAVTEGQLRAARIGLQQLLEGEDASESDLRSQLEDISGHEINIRLGDIATNNSIKGMLTDEQWTQFQQENRRGQLNRGGRGGRAFRRGGGLRNRAVFQGRGGNFRGRDQVSRRGFRGGRGGNLQRRGANPGFRRFGGARGGGGDDQQFTPRFRLRSRIGGGGEQSNTLSSKY